MQSGFEVYGICFKKTKPVIGAVYFIFLVTNIIHIFIHKILFNKMAGEEPKRACSIDIIRHLKTYVHLVVIH